MRRGKGREMTRMLAVTSNEPAALPPEVVLIMGQPYVMKIA